MKEIERVFISRATIFLVTMHMALSSDHNYTLVNNTKTWAQAKQRCEDINKQLATGNISNILSVVPEGTSAFIGMVEFDEWLWFEGCYTPGTGVLLGLQNGPGVKSKNSSVLFSSCVAKCYSFEYIAVSKDKTCYCLSKNWTSSKKSWTLLEPKFCLRFDDTFLMRGGNSRLYVYRMDHVGRTDIHRQSQEPRYGSVRLEDKYFSGRGCKDKQNVLYNVTSRNGHSNSMTWDRALQSYISGSIYLEHEKIKNKSCDSCGDHYEVWVGLFKVTVRKEVSKDDNLTRISEYLCGRLSKYENATYDIAYEVCNKSIPFVCENVAKDSSNRQNQTENNVNRNHKNTDSWSPGDNMYTTLKDNPHIPSTTSKITYVTHGGNGSKGTDSTENVHVKDSSHHPITTSKITVVTREGNGSKGANSTAMLIVIATAVGVLVLIIAVVGFCLIRRRLKRRNDENKPSEDRYAEVTYVPEDRQANNKATNRTLDVGKDDVRGVKADTAGQGEYDVFHRPHQKTNPTEDVYDHARAPNHDDNNYDHMPNYKGANVNADNTYDHTTNIRLHTIDADDTYDHTHIGHTSGDDYDHLANVLPNDQKDINNYDCA